MDIHLVQMDIVRGDPRANRAKVEALTAGIKPGKPGLVILPELFSTGFVDEAALDPRNRDGNAWRMALEGPEGGGVEALAAADAAILAGLARRLGCWVARTTLEAGPDPGDGSPRLGNASRLFDPRGAFVARYRKVHPFSYGGEDRMFTRGEEIVTPDLEGWVLQLSICYDLRFPELYRAGSLRGVHLIVVHANWPSARHAHWEALLKARAIENQAFVAGVNCSGTQGSLAYGGGSSLISPKGEMIAHAGAGECLLRGQADLDDCKQWRKQFPALRDRMPWDFFLS